MRWLALVLLAGCARAEPPAAKTCDSCHAKEAREWRDSFHRVAFTDTTFQRSLALEAPKNRAFCTNCHAPDGEAHGVGCTSCHAEPHAKDAIASANASCAHCHQFSFADRADLVQKTMAEHAASDLPERACSACHMGMGSHQFKSGHDLGWLRGSVEVKARRVGADVVQVELHPWTGHDFPTGDMFRRAELVVVGEDADGAIVTSAERIFGRTWGADAKGARVELSDTRIRGTFREDVKLDAGAGPARPIARVHWTLYFQRVLSQHGDDITLVSNDIIGEGEAH